MRNVPLIIVGISLTALALTGCSSAAPGGGGSAGASPGAANGSSGGSSSASGPTSKVDVCTTFPAAALSSASGKAFGKTLEVDQDGVYSCLYQLTSGSGGWIVDIREPSDGDNPTTDGLDLGGSSAVKPVSGTGYTTVASPAGVELQLGKDVVEVYTAATAGEAQGTTAQFVAVAKAVIAALGS